MAFRAIVVAGTSRVGGLALLHVLGLRSPDGLAEPIARAIPADRNAMPGTVPIGVSSEGVGGVPSTGHPRR
ncbi:MAG: hypothetical protein ACRDRA_06965 [Pseudonocardiaceae bacterium]